MDKAGTFHKPPARLGAAPGRFGPAILKAVVLLTTMKKKEHPLDEPGQQWSWKITLTVVCAVIGAVLALYLFRVL